MAARQPPPPGTRSTSHDSIAARSSRFEKVRRSAVTGSPPSEATRTREKAQLRLEGSAAQLRGGEGSVEFAQCVGLTIGRQAEQNSCLLQFAEDFRRAGHQARGPLKPGVLV